MFDMSKIMLLVKHSLGVKRVSLERQFLSNWLLRSYDGAGVISGCVRGAAACIHAEYPKALLCVMQCCKIREVPNVMVNCWFYCSFL